MVRIHLAGVGGAFGGREDLSMQIHGALRCAAEAAGEDRLQPRGVVLRHVHRHPARIWCEHRDDGGRASSSVRMKILLDGGAYASSSTAVTSNAACFAIGPYKVANALIESTCVYTNNPPCGAMRGFGAVQTRFAAEAQMDKLAAELGIDPVELRLLNALGSGDTLPTGQVIEGVLPTAEVIRRAAALPEAEALRARRSAFQAGLGIRPAARASSEESASRSVQEHLLLGGLRRLHGSVLLRADGSAEVHCASAEVGQGVTDVILQVARTELGTDDVVLAYPERPRSDLPGPRRRAG